MKKKFFTYKNLYLIYLLILVVMVVACVININGILKRYEEIRPEAKVESIMAELVEDAKSGEFFTVYEKPAVTAGEYEKDVDLYQAYLDEFVLEELTYRHTGGSVEADNLSYVVENDGLALAEIMFKAAGPAEQKLLILKLREWDVEYVKPLLQAKEYTLSVPDTFKVVVNGAELGEAAIAENKSGVTTYAIKDVYLKPAIQITNKDGAEVKYSFVGEKVMAEFYNYVLTLPNSLKVTVNGTETTGEALADGTVRYAIELLEKPEIVIADKFGNTTNYTGGDIPFTYRMITADEYCTVKVNGTKVEGDYWFNHPEYAALVDFTDSIPMAADYSVAVLDNNAEITVEDKNGNLIPLAEGEVVQDLTDYHIYLDAVPEEVSAEVDVLELAKQWSLFMSADVPFRNISKYLVAGSYQYDVAKKYSTSIDITFTSSHTFAEEPFTECEVKNFLWISDDCFSVDISFVKHMIVRGNQAVDDEMNDRFYFIKYDDTNDNVDNAAWKIISMKEIVD